MKRHLLFHIMPDARNRWVWQRCIDQLRARRHLFDGGRRIAAIATGGPELDPPDAVRRYAGDLFTDYVEVPNDPSLREVATWCPLWESLFPHLGCTDHVLYAHAKGVTRPPDSAAHTWADMLFRTALDHPTPTAELLTRYPIVGSYLLTGDGYGPTLNPAQPGVPHYTGTFFWLRADDIEDHLAVPPPRLWFGVESWPRAAFAANEMGVLFHESPARTAGGYDPRWWRDKIIPEYREWLKLHPCETTESHSFFPHLHVSADPPPKTVPRVKPRYRPASVGGYGTASLK